MLIPFASVYGGTLLLPLAVLAAAFVYARVRQDEPLDLVSGVSAYLSIMIAASAVLIALGAGHVLKAIFADLNKGFTYGPGEVFGTAFGSPVSAADATRQDADLSGGLGFVIVGVAIATLHTWLRGRLLQSGDLDTGVERAVEVLAALVLGLVTLVLAAGAIGTAVERLSYGEDAGAPGELLAYAITFAAVWLIYGARSFIAVTAPPDAEDPTDESAI